jgi:hypothetical protein
MLERYPLVKSILGIIPRMDGLHRPSHCCHWVYRPTLCCPYLFATDPNDPKIIPVARTGDGSTPKSLPVGGHNLHQIALLYLTHGLSRKLLPQRKIRPFL